MKEDFFSKFKDYNKELEKILEKKDFSKEAKNLLLSMFYKLDISYNDYFTVKTNSITKQEYLENILNNIKACNYVEIVQATNKTEFKEIQNNGSYNIDLKLKRIKVLENELAILAALLELNNFEIHLKEKYNLIRNSMPYLLNMAYDMENIEVIRDFNAWSWNTFIEEIKDININLIYQNLKIALNTNIFTKIQEENIEDIMQKMEQILLKVYSKNTVEEFINLILKLSIMIYIKVSDNERKRLFEEKISLETELYEINNKKEYIDKISLEKKELSKKLKKIDLIINNQDMLLEEYKQRNKVLPEYNKIFSLSHLVDKLQKEREKIKAKIYMCNKKSSPKNYLENKNKLQTDFDLLKDISFKEKNNIYKYLDELQEFFIKNIFLKKILSATTREELLNCVYELRYYSFIPYDNNKTIKEVEYLKPYLEELKEVLIKKLYDNKIINIFSTNEKCDIEIVKNIFDLKIINMENIYIELKKDINKYIVNTYDEKETLEKEFEIELKLNPKDKIKLNKKIKLFKFER